MGWVFIFFSLVLLGISGFLGYYGQQLLTEPSPPTSFQQPDEHGVVLEPQQEKLLQLIYNYQTGLGQNKLIISRSDGRLLFDEEAKREKHKINLFSDLYGIESDFKKKESEFENLITSVPQLYLRFLPETRLNSPYVVQITDDGISYVRN